MKRISKILNKMYETISHFRIFEWAVLKVYLIIIGVLIGTYFSDFFMQNIKLVWIAFLVLFIFTMYFMFIKKYDKKDIKDSDLERK